MEIKDIPQDDSESYHGHLKVIYGTRDGRYEAGTSSGWQGEAVARGEYSPLYYHMFRFRHDEAGLAMAAGVWKWQLRRHLRPEIFAKLPDKTLQKYADALQISIDELKRTDAD